MNVEGLNKTQTDILMAIIQSLGVDRMQSFRSLLKSFGASMLNMLLAVSFILRQIGLAKIN